MKRLVGMLAAGLLVLGASASFAAPGGACEGAVDASCTVKDENGRDKSCTVYVAAGLPADGCHNA